MLNSKTLFLLHLISLYFRNLFFLFTKIPLKTKSAPTEADAQKTQTPIVAKLIQYNKHYCTHIVGICIFIKFMK